MKELEDYEWFPQSLRRMQMEYIGWLAIKLGLYEPVLKTAKGFLESHPVTQIMDLCTGTGMPATYLHGKLGLSSPPILTDLYPDRDDIRLLDVKDIESDQLSGLITMCNAFHHFDRSEQMSVLQSISQSRQPSLIVEILQPTLLCYLQVAVGTTLGQLLFAPFVHPFSIRRLLLTYLLPINLVTVTYDGLISVSKSKSKKAYQTLLSDLSIDNYHWEAITRPTKWLATVTILQGQPI